MLEVNFSDEKLRDLGNMFGTEELPEGTMHISVDGRAGIEPTAFERLAKMLNRSTTTRIRHVTLKNIFSISPDYLAALIAIAKKAEWLTLMDAVLADPGCACLMTCMMQPDGLKELEILDCGNTAMITIAQAMMLFEGIAYSTSLERLGLLRLPYDGSLNDDAGRAFVHALRRNRSLKNLNLQLKPFTDPVMIANILRAAILETKVETIDICQCDSPGSVPFHIFKDLIYRENCSLDTLYLHDIAIDMSYISKLPTIEVKNSSLKSLILDENRLNSSMATYIAAGCKSLTYLDVSDNLISDLAPFDKLLLGDDAKLQCLVINSNPISDEDFLVFLKKLPRMKSLRGLDMKNLSILKSKAGRDALLEAVWRNTSLECVCCYEDDEDDDDENDDNERRNQDNEDVDLFRTMLPIPLSWNRGGRRELQNLPTNALPRGVWSRVLHRAMTLKYCAGSDYYEYPENTALRLDVVYWLLRKKFLV